MYFDELSRFAQLLNDLTKFYFNHIIYSDKGIKSLSVYFLLVYLHGYIATVIVMKFGSMTVLNFYFKEGLGYFNSGQRTKSREKLVS